MNKEGIKYTKYKEALGNDYYLEKLLLMHSVAWIIYKEVFRTGSNTGTNIDNLPHPGIIDRKVIYWNNELTAEQEARTVATQLRIENINRELLLICEV